MATDRVEKKYIPLYSIGFWLPLGKGAPAIPSPEQKASPCLGWGFSSPFALLVREVMATATSFPAGLVLPGVYWPWAHGVGLFSSCMNMETSWWGDERHPLAWFLFFRFCSWSIPWRNETWNLKLSHTDLWLVHCLHNSFLIRRDHAKAKGFSF